ncbi:MAG: putative transposase [Saprospiraceae bacterium]|jgi:putative transposase|tara:strand:- start:1547 stop:1813 length:267 start_codon:yes stop_codon:yes gene_type:complete
MKRSKFTETQIIKAIKANEAGRSVEELSRELGINKGTFYSWRKQYSGMEASQLKELKSLKEENSKLKRMYAEQALQLEMAKDVISKKW